MYSQSQSPQLDSAAPATSTSTSAVATSTAATSNQAAVQDAGLAPTADADGGLLGEFAELVLGAMPLQAALPLAAAHLAEAAVRSWVLEQDPTQAVQALSFGLKDRLFDQWPVGLGVFVCGEAGAALGLEADVEGDIELTRTGRDQIVARVKAKAMTGLAELGAKIEVEGGGERAIAAVAAAAKVGVELGLNGEARRPMDVTMMLAMGAAASPGVLLGLLAGQQVLDIAAGATGLDLPQLIAPGSYAMQGRAALVADARVSGAEAPLDGFGVDFATLLPDLAPYLSVLQGFFDGHLKGEVELLTGTGGAQLLVRSSLSATAELAGMPLLADLLDWPLLDVLADELGGMARLELAVGLRPDGGTIVPAFDGRLSLLLEAQREDAKSTDRIDFHIDELPEVLERLRGGEGLAALLGGAGFQRCVELPAPAGLIEEVVPGAAFACTEMLADSFLLAGEDDLHLTGQLTAGPEVMQMVAAAGIEVPAELGLLDALEDVHNALCAFACHQTTIAAWLEPFGPDLLQAAQAIVMAPPRLVGRVRMSAGFSAEVTAGGTAGVEGKGAAGFAVDRIVDADAAVAVRQALAAGAFVVPSAQAPGVDELGECAVADANGQSDTGTDTAAGGAVDPATECAA